MGNNKFFIDPMTTLFICISLIIISTSYFKNKICYLKLETLKSCNGNIECIDKIENFYLKGKN